MIDAMYGEGFEYRWGVVDGLCAIAIGGDVDSAGKKLEIISYGADGKEGGEGLNTDLFTGDSN